MADKIVTVYWPYICSSRVRYSLGGTEDGRESLRCNAPAQNNNKTKNKTKTADEIVTVYWPYICRSSKRLGGTGKGREPLLYNAYADLARNRLVLFSVYTLTRRAHGA